MSEIPEDVDVSKEIEKADPAASIPENAVDKSSTKAEAAVALFVYGVSFTEIKNKLGYSSAHRARIAVERALAASADSTEDRDMARVVVRKQLRRLLAAHMPQAVDIKNPNQLAYSARTLAIIDRLGKLDGVDAPTQIQISASDSDIMNFVEMLMPEAKKDNEAIEADIVDAEVLD